MLETKNGKKSKKKKHLGKWLIIPNVNNFIKYKWNKSVKMQQFSDWIKLKTKP